MVRYAARNPAYSTNGFGHSMRDMGSSNGYSSNGYFGIRYRTPNWKGKNAASPAANASCQRSSKNPSTGPKGYRRPPPRLIPRFVSLAPKTHPLQLTET